MARNLQPRKRRRRQRKAEEEEEDSGYIRRNLFLVMGVAVGVALLVVLFLWYSMNERH